MNLWEGVAEFTAVAERQSFTAAAKMLGLSVAQVSRQINQLEKRLNNKLFYRTTRKVSLTEEGKIYFRHCQPLMQGLEDAEQALSSLSVEPAGHLKLTAPVTYGEKYIMPLVTDFMQRYPKIEVEAELTNKTVDLVADGFDLAIRIGHLQDSSMMATKLSSRVQFVCGAPSYFERFGMPHSLSDLSEHHCLLGNYDFWRFSVKGQEHKQRIKGKLRCNSGIALRHAASQGVGLVQLPDYYVKQDIQQGKLLPVLQNYQIPKENIWALYPHNRQLSPKVRWLIGTLAEGLHPSTLDE